MAEIIKRNKALAVSPLKASQTMGAALAFLGIKDTIAMLHGAQGCTAYGKIFLIGHFREPVPLQTTAMDQVSTVMGADTNVVEGLATICAKNAPALIGLPTTGLAETEGSDTAGSVNVFRKEHPEHDGTAIVAVETPDYAGSLEAGFAKAVTAMIDKLVPEAEEKGGDPASDRVTVLVNGALSPGDIEEVKEIVEAFGLEPVVLPDLSGSLDGHLADADFSPLTTGGTDIAEFARLHEARATLVIGESLSHAADLLAARTGVPEHRFAHLMGLDAVDAFIDTLRRISGRDVPARLSRQRAQLQDAMLDAHFHLGMVKMAVAADPDLLKAYGALVHGMGAELSVAVAPSNAPVLKSVPCEAVKIGDLEDLEKLSRAAGVELVIGNAHCAATAERLEVPLHRAGFPQFDRMGAPAKVSVGYRGSRQVLFDLGNLMIEAEPATLAPYRSIYAQDGADDAASSAAEGM
ncbi:nitrogenase iron-molybdenum cofactor biosynthesis protein NifN [Rhodobium gokarnense]|uniref:Nitrogenase iron-molybdenum cofactor biosynthesis protein NifN n=1 Tax=Rhodobium gokarnense TaxID=364296 RepID=A0ABT3H944_9HYPH|nr:nitrogenase iron-molybdenum cofactor biosynthesis protein NifN [Rhodobium gokarnense]MCW2306905.1 nitrogenase molybdenum-iron protein NifN [Rhodobium gokarnense]